MAGTEAVSAVELRLSAEPGSVVRLFEPEDPASTQELASSSAIATLRTIALPNNSSTGYSPALRGRSILGDGLDVARGVAEINELMSLTLGVQTGAPRRCVESAGMVPKLPTGAPERSGAPYEQPFCNRAE
ncbi:MAG: hypothetical protein AAF550_14275 [Myxococcota bacterium]